jgi:hypothetical protein
MLWRKNESFYPSTFYFHSSSMWYVAYGMWHVACGMWSLIIFFFFFVRTFVQRYQTSAKPEPIQIGSNGI